MNEASRMAGLSVDVDSVSMHLRGYGVFDAPDDGRSYTTAIPRALSLFRDAGARATFFLIGEEAERHPEVVRSIVDAGHEVASHSMTHRLPFDLSDPARVTLEIERSKSVLERLSGRPVEGFRAPSWGVNAELFSYLRSAGYRYDASSFPSWMLFLLRWSVSRKSAPNRERIGTSIKQGLFERASPHVVRHAGGTMVEIPVSTTPLFRLPYYHTLRFLLPAGPFRVLGAVARSRLDVTTYIFHAVDFLELEGDHLDPRIARHPGMVLPLPTKLDLARRSLRELSVRRKLSALGDVAGALLRE